MAANIKALLPLQSLEKGIPQTSLEDSILDSIRRISSIVLQQPYYTSLILNLIGDLHLQQISFYDILCSLHHPSDRVITDKNSYEIFSLFFLGHTTNLKKEALKRSCPLPISIEEFNAQFLAAVTLDDLQKKILKSICIKKDPHLQDYCESCFVNLSALFIRSIICHVSFIDVQTTEYSSEPEGFLEDEICFLMGQDMLDCISFEQFHINLHRIQQGLLQDPFIFTFYQEKLEEFNNNFVVCLLKRKRVSNSAWPHLIVQKDSIPNYLEAVLHLLNLDINNHVHWTVGYLIAAYLPRDLTDDVWSWFELFSYYSYQGDPKPHIGHVITIFNKLSNHFVFIS